MALRPPCELASRTLLQALRVLVARLLCERGVSQSKAAKLIGVSQAAVNKYVRLDEESVRRLVTRTGLSFNEAMELAGRIAELILGADTEAAMMEYCCFCLKARVSGLLCDIHRRVCPPLSQCRLCSKLFSPLAEGDIEVSLLLKRAIALLESSTSFPLTIPEVSSNLVMALRGAKSLSDVMGIPGRIVKLMDRARAVGEPMRGSSRHLATVLLTVMDVFPQVRAAINLKYDDIMERSLRSLGVKVLYTRSTPRTYRASDDDVIRDIGRVVRDAREPPDAIVDPGGIGLEPITYVFGEDAVDVALKALRLSDRYAEYLSSHRMTVLG